MKSINYIDVLKHPVVGRLSLIQFLSYFGTWFSQVAIASMLVEYRASELAIAMVFIMLMLPSVLLAPLSGFIVDRVSFKKLMTILLFTEISMTLLFMTINSIDAIGWLMLFVFIRSTASSMLFTAEMSLFPKILNGEMLKRTNELHSIIWSVCFALGMAIGGVVTYYFSYDTTFLVDVSLYLLATLVLIDLKIELKVVEHTQGAIEMMKSGFLYLKNHKKLIHLLFIHAVLGLTSFDTIITILADKHYSAFLAVPLAIGWINATRAFGLAMGGAFLSRFIDKNTLHYAFALQGVVIIIWAIVQHDFVNSLILMFFVGLFTTSLWAYTYYMIQQETKEEFLGRVIAYNDMLFMLSNITVTLFIGILAKVGVSMFIISSSLGVGFLLSALYYRWFKRVYLKNLI